MVIWHEMDIAAESHIHLSLLTTHPSSFLSPGQNPAIHGNIKAMPMIAAYDSWKPTSMIESGIIARCMIRAAITVFFRFACLWLSLIHSPITMNMNARVIDAPAPVASV